MSIFSGNFDIVWQILTVDEASRGTLHQTYVVLPFFLAILPTTRLDVLRPLARNLVVLLPRQAMLPMREELILKKLDQLVCQGNLAAAAPVTNELRSRVARQALQP